MEYEIRHTGTITAVDDKNRTATVKITDSAASDCAGCAVRSLCHPAGNSSETTDITVSTESSQLHPIAGMRAEIGLPASGRYKAMVTALGIPCLLLAAVALALPATGVGQEISASCALGTVAVYYGVLYLMRSKVRSRFRWRLIAVVPNEPQRPQPTKQTNNQL